MPHLDVFVMPRSQIKTGAAQLNDFEKASIALTISQMLGNFKSDTLRGHILKGHRTIFVKLILQKVFKGWGDRHPINQSFVNMLAKKAVVRCKAKQMVSENNLHRRSCSTKKCISNPKEFTNTILR